MPEQNQFFWKTKQKKNQLASLNTRLASLSTNPDRDFMSLRSEVERQRSTLNNLDVEISRHKGRPLSRFGK